MNRDRRLLIVLGLVFVALAALLVLQSQPAAAPTFSQNRVFDGLREGDLQAVRLTNPPEGLSLTLVRALDGVSWTVPDSAGTLNQDVAMLIARTMILLPAINTVQPEQEMSVYGLLPTPGITVEFILFDGTAHSVAVGFRNPTETGYYAAVDERPDIYILERAAVDFLISVLRNPPIA